MTNNSSFQYTGDSVLDTMSKYAVNRNKSVETLIRKYLGFSSTQCKLHVLEFGAGRGEFIQRFKKEPLLDLYIVELDENYFQRLSSGYNAFREIDEVKDESMDCIYLIDVLEHIENDTDMLKRFYQKLKPKGKLFIYVPARMELFSDFDRGIGHFRRYYKKELGQKVKDAGFTIGTIRYHEIIGYFAAFYNKFFFRKEGLDEEAVQVYDKYLVPSTNFIEGFINPPIGKSLYVLAYK